MLRACLVEKTPVTTKCTAVTPSLGMRRSELDSAMMRAVSCRVL
jgi:hypothetical protein